MSNKEHWENVYKTKSSDSVSWFQSHSEKSIKIICELEADLSAKIIDVGGGASTLVDDLVNIGYSNLSVLDVSGSALAISKHRLGNHSKNIKWIESDVTQLKIPKHSIDVWHDRAVFHFLTDANKRKKYVDAVISAIKPGGHLIISTFSLEGPEEGSGLTVQRYNKESLDNEFSSSFQLLDYENENHMTPFSTQQKFIYCYWKANMQTEAT